MSTVIVTDKKYKVDPLYQWDQGQVLEIRGLSMEKAPEIHFDNGSLGGAIVRQSEMDDAGIIRANIPNSLLQRANKIIAYICISGEEEFKSLYSIEITVKARKKPEFYEVVDEYEIYSIDALTIEVEQALAEYKDLNGQYEEIVNAIEEDREILEEAIDTYNKATAKVEANIATLTTPGTVKPDGTTITIESDGTIHAVGGGTEDYTDLVNKPTINGVELVGNLTDNDLNIQGVTNYVDLTNKPKINGVELKGELTSEDLNIGGENVVYCTQAEYDALPDSKLTDGVEYRITDAGINETVASNIKYNNSNSGLEATTVQTAIDKVSERLDNKLVLKTKTVNGTTSVFGLTESLLNDNQIYVKCEMAIPDSFHFLSPSFYDKGHQFTLYNCTDTSRQIVANTAFLGTIWYLEIE